MDILVFNNQTYEDRCESIATEGAYLAFRYVENMKIYLYALDNYYVEVSFSPYHHKIVSLEAFQDVSMLGPYLEFINIDQLTI